VGRGSRAYGVRHRPSYLFCRARPASTRSIGLRGKRWPVADPRVPRECSLPTTLGSEDYEWTARLTRWTLKDLLTNACEWPRPPILPEPRRPDCDTPRSSPRKRIAIDSTSSVRVGDTAGRKSFLMAKSEGYYTFVMGKNHHEM
jgi:hypothetical protein